MPGSDLNVKAAEAGQETHRRARRVSIHNFSLLASRCSRGLRWTAVWRVSDRPRDQARRRSAARGRIARRSAAAEPRAAACVTSPRSLIGNLKELPAARSSRRRRHRRRRGLVATLWTRRRDATVRCPRCCHTRWHCWPPAQAPSRQLAASPGVRACPNRLVVIAQQAVRLSRRLRMRRAPRT
jgi:hypothetical protein